MPRFADVAFWLAAALGAVLVAVLALGVVGLLPVEETASEVVTAPLTPPPQPAPDEPGTTAEPPRTQPAPAEVTVVVRAARGDSWLSARLDSENGRVLDERLLPQGETARVTGRRVWLLLGAPANVDVTVNGRPRRLDPGTSETVFAADAS